MKLLLSKWINNKYFFWPDLIDNNFFDIIGSIILLSRHFFSFNFSLSSNKIKELSILNNILKNT